MCERPEEGRETKEGREPRQLKAPVGPKEHNEASGKQTTVSKLDPEVTARVWSTNCSF